MFKNSSKRLKHFKNYSSCIKNYYVCKYSVGIIYDYSFLNKKQNKKNQLIENWVLYKNSIYPSFFVHNILKNKLSKVALEKNKYIVQMVPTLS